MRTQRHKCAGIAAGLVLLTACADDVSPKADDSPSADAAGAADYVLLLDDDSDPDQVLGEPGAYALTARGSGTPPLAVLDVPSGYSNFGFFALWPFGSGDEGSAQEQEPFRAVQYWTVHGVFAEPCHRKGGAATVIGPSVKALAAALKAQKLTSVSEPRPVSLDGHRGLYLELRVSVDVRFDDCDDGGYFMLWEGMPADAQHTADSPGTIERLWIVDVDGERIVLAATAAAGVTHGLAKELTDMVESVRFVEPQ
jgi:hypothetical protein